MTRLDRVALREIRLPLKEPFRISSGTVTERRICLLELRDSDGLSTWAECVAGEQPNYSSETIDTAWVALREFILPRAFETPIDDPASVYAALSRNVCGHNMAKAAVEMGCWALAALRDGVSLARRVAGGREGTRDAIVTGISLGIQATPADLVARAVRARADGFRKIKLKVAPGMDVAFVAAVREALGPDVALMADANSSYTPADAAHLKELDRFGLIMIEQPLGRDDLVRHAALQRELRTPLCLDESITDVDRAEDMIALGSGRIINIKPGRVGGFAQAVAIHDLAQQHGIPVWCGGMLESGVGRAYNVALASLPNFSLPSDLSPSARYWERDVVTPEWTMDADGLVHVPRDVPGIGVAVDVDRVDYLTVRRKVFTPHAAAAVRAAA
ncbi:o-succinylbenzoate synthase [Gemmatimonadetes bacterium T265]|nr:o-succinylbenzoate synthase [Gemmatimonadetes bacterium T265]